MSIISVGLLLLSSSAGLSQSTILPAEYIEEIQQKIEENLIYPSETEINQREGVVVVRFTLLRDGQIKDLEIAKSSGDPLLDEAAISAVKYASPYPSLKNYPDEEELKVVLPIVNYQTGKEPAPPLQELSLFEEVSLDESPSSIEELPISSFQPKEETRLSLSTELEEFMALAIANNQPTQIAQEEIKLAEFKIKEPFRNLFPAVKVEAYHTEGEVEELFEYKEKELKVQLDQPIYYGGRLKDSLRQSRVNLEITKRNYDRLKIDVANKTEVAYYNLVAARMNLKAQKAILKEAKKVLEIVQRQFAAGLVIPLEISSAQSWFDQINFQIDSTKQDMALAELTFMQVLNISEPIEINQEKLKINDLDLALDTCLEAGLEHRPEIYLSELLVEFNQYGKKIEDSKSSFTIDLTGSYGFYEGAYETEEMASSDTWYIGFKASKPWGGSTLNTSATTEEGGPHYGETTRTKTSTISGDFNLLDNLQRLSEQKQAEIELQRAVSDLNETIKTINFEIKDAYLNYQKALLQATTAQSEVDFRSREVEVSKIRAQVGEIGHSNVMEVLVSLSRAQTTYIEALTNYFISLTNLKKAAGYGLPVNRNKS